MSGTVFEQKLSNDFELQKSCFKAIPNGRKLSRLLQIQKEMFHQIFTKFTEECLIRRRSLSQKIFKNKEIVLGAVTRKDGHVDSFLGHKYCYLTRIILFNTIHFICTQTNSSKNCYVILIILFRHTI